MCVQDHGSGWEYARDFQAEAHSTPHRTDFTRRRRWHRDMVLKQRNVQRAFKGLAAPPAGTFLAYKRACGPCPCPRYRARACVPPFV